MNEKLTVRKIRVSGIALCTACLLLQLVVLKWLPRNRRLDQKILTQMTVAGLVYTITLFYNGAFLLDIYSESVSILESVVICWILRYTDFLFAKAMQSPKLDEDSTEVFYNKIMSQLMFQSYKFILLFTMSWFIGKYLYLLLITLFFYLLYFIIQSERRVRQGEQRRYLNDLAILSVIMYILFSVMVYGVIYHSLFMGCYPIVYDIFLILNSFQGVLITIVFIINAMYEI